MASFVPFSPKQKKLLSWWCPGSPLHNKRGIICDGAVRSGKTLCMSLSFVLWAFFHFDSQDFAVCGRTLGSVRRNLIIPLVSALNDLGFQCSEKISRSILEIHWNGRFNRFYLFSGKDESSAALIQGITLAGVLFDEVALMPRSFVEQAVARCSVSGSKLWFNCNPENPYHWFYTEWIQQVNQKQLAYLHFTMDDNPSLSDEVKQRYHSLYSGAFYKRFVLGEWAAAQGAVYPMFDENIHVTDQIPPCSQYYVSCDYGTVNPTSMGLWGRSGDVWYRIAEFYHDSRRTGILKTDGEYYQELESLTTGYPVQSVIVDPSAASFIECIRRHGKFSVIPAKNDVLAGIRAVSDLLKSAKLKFHPSCKDTFREFALYRWDESAGRDLPVKQYDHAMDDIRYLVMTVIRQQQDAFFAVAAPRDE